MQNYYIRPARQGNRPRMERSERAKQFMPFSALKGYTEALRQKEKIFDDNFGEKIGIEE